MGGLVPSRLRENERERGKREERAGPERGALCCYPPHRISQSNIHLGCRLPALRTLSKTNLPPCFYRPSCPCSFLSSLSSFLPSSSLAPAQKVSSLAPDLWRIDQRRWWPTNKKEKNLDKRAEMRGMQMLPGGARGVVEWCESFAVAFTVATPLPFGRFHTLTVQHLYQNARWGDEWCSSMSQSRKDGARFEVWGRQHSVVVFCIT